MLTPNWTRYLHALSLVAIVVLASGAFWLLYSTYQRSVQEQGKFRENLTSIAAQFDYELLTLIDTLEQFSKPDSGVDHEQVMRRFDVLWSRTETTSSGEIGRYFLRFDGAKLTVENVRRTLETIEPSVANLNPVDRPGIKAITTTLRQLKAEVHAITIGASNLRSEEATERHREDAKAQMLLMIFLVGVLVTGSVVVGVLTTERYQLNELSKDLEKRVEERTAEYRAVNTALEKEIVERQGIEADLRNRETQLRQAQSMAKLGVFIWDDINARPLYYSQEFAALMGLSPAELMKTQARHDQILELIVPEDRKRYSTTVRQAEKDVSAYVVDFRMADGRGQIRHWRQSGEPVVDRHGRLHRTFGTVQDITDIKHREDALQESEWRYRALFEESALPLLEEDWREVKHYVDKLKADGAQDLETYLRVHPQHLHAAYHKADRHGVTDAVVKLFGAKDKRDFQAAFLQRAAVPSGLHGFACAICAFERGETSFDHESEEVARDGTKLRVRTKFVLPSRYRDDWSRVFETMEDVTEFRRAEERLVQSQKLEAVGQLTGGVAHDFNNLLAIIQGNAELLAEPAMGNRPERLDAIMQATQRGADLTQRLLSFSRRQSLRPVSFNMRRLVEGMLAMLDRTLGEEIEISADFAGGLENAFADPAQMENALVNLAINARDAMPLGGELVISCRNVDAVAVAGDWLLDVQADEFVMMSVSDSGIGMPPRVLSRAFEPFFTTKDVGHGSGLGLSMVYGFAKQSGGHVDLTSQRGAGTTVTLYLPRDTSSAPITVESNIVASPHGGGQRILLVEDDAQVRPAVREVLESLRYDVVAVANALEALEVLDASERFDVVLTDVVLPGGIDGVELVARIRGIDASQPVLFMSGYPDHAASLQQHLGAEDILLAKPFRRSQIAQVLNSILA